MSLGIASIGGNGLSVRVFYLKLKEITVPELLLMNIAVVNLLLAIASYPAFIVSSFCHQWIFGNIGERAIMQYHFSSSNQSNLIDTNTVVPHPLPPLSLSLSLSVSLNVLNATLGLHYTTDNSRIIDGRGPDEVWRSNVYLLRF